ncbi:hypothetical protein HDA40_003361 [Hamadaea flava]|uniref:Uncharacterized protein n=1 Tax=Hamadaea flava TaxID=1742688 RepID=A0ABV8LJQ8_9ACTN|nr:hypothetical protein [Hamadaea flava]MCP2324854.1 hypothetical protein [Hamadaea flava]
MTDTPIGAAGTPDDSVLRHWRLLVAVVAPVVAVATLVQSVLELLGSSGTSVVVDGLTLRTPGWLDVVEALVWLVAWAWSVGAVMIAVRGTLSGEPPSAFDALRQAARRLPGLLTTLLLAVTGLGACIAVGVVIGGFLGPLAWACIAVAGYFGAPIVAAAAYSVLDERPAWDSVGRAVEVGRTRRRQLFLLLMGLAAAAVPAGWLSASLPDVTAGPVTAAVGRLAVAALTVAAIGVQGALLARWRVRLNDARSQSAPAPCPGHWLVACGGLTVVVVVATGIVIVNPLGVPVLTTSGTVKTSQNLGEYAVTADGEPKIGVGGSSRPLAWDTRRALFDGGTAMVGIAYPGNGPVELTICQADDCVPAEARLDRPGFYWEHWVARSLPGGGLIVVAPVVERGTLSGTAKLVAWICPDRSCQSSRRIELADVNYDPPQDFPLAVTVGPEGAPVIAYGSVGSATVFLVRCADQACGSTTMDPSDVAVDVDGAWPGLVGLGFDGDAHVVAVLAGKTPPPPAGLRIRVGRTPRARVISITCGDERCLRRTTRAWNEIADDGGDLRAWPVSMPDGHLAILQEDARGARLITCEHHCEG